MVAVIDGWIIDEYGNRMGKTNSASRAKPVKNILKQDPCFGVEKVIFNDPATIVMWTDKTKTVVKCHDEAFDPEKGLAMAICKKVMGNQGNYYGVIRKLLEEADS